MVSWSPHTHLGRSATRLGRPYSPPLLPSPSLQWGRPGGHLGQEREPWGWLSLGSAELMMLSSEIRALG